jgi:AbiJ N-terminal domain 4
MLTDIFAYRYLEQPIWIQYTETEQRLLNQCFSIVKDALPYYSTEGKVIKANEEKWKLIHDKLASELGVSELSKRYYSYTGKNAFGNELPVSGWYNWDIVCNGFVNAKYNSQIDADRFIKERISFVELALRHRDEEIALINSQLAANLAGAAGRKPVSDPAFRMFGNENDIKSLNKEINSIYESQVDELNERFRRAKAPLTYHNGFIQFAKDEVIEKHIAKPFWELVADPIWKNVDTDMKESLDRRDSNDKAPAFFAAKALESAIKIVSETKGWTKGTEKGASQFIDNLMSKTNGNYLTTWEGEMLKDYFNKVRNSLGHGSGSKPMPILSLEQTDWAIETAMSWIRTLVRRL